MIRVIGKTRLWTALGCTAGATAVMAWPLAAAGGVSRGLSLCGEVLIPSLFPFLVLGGILVHSGTARALGRRLSPVMRWLFGLSGSAAPALLIGMIGGYPAGAIATAELYKSGALSRDEARRLLGFCVCAGPAFTVNTVGVRLMNNRGFGWLLFAAQVLSLLVIGLLSRRPPASSQATPPTPAVSFPSALVKAVTAASETVLYLCGFVLLFSAVLSLCEASGATAVLGGKAPLACLLEVGNGCAAATQTDHAVPLLGFAVGFGGVSVCCQIAAATRGTDLMSRGFFVSRVVHGGLSVLFTHLLCRLFPLCAPVFGGNNTPVAAMSADSAAVSVCLLVLCGIWLLIIPTGFFQKDVV